MSRIILITRGLNVNLFFSRCGRITQCTIILTYVAFTIRQRLRALNRTDKGLGNSGLINVCSTFTTGIQAFILSSLAFTATAKACTLYLRRTRRNLLNTYH